MSHTLSRRSRATTARGLAARLGNLSFEARIVLAICLLALILRLWPLGGGSVEYDEGVYWQSLRAMAHGQPLFSAIFSSQPPFFLLCLYPLYLLFGQSLVAARLAVALYSLAGIVAVYFAGKSLGGRWTGVIAAALLALDPLYLTQSHTLQAEAPAVAFELICIALLLAGLRQSGPRRRVLVVASGAACALGILIKLFDVAVIVPAVLYLATPLLRPVLGTSGRPRVARWAEVRVSVHDAAPDLVAWVGGLVAALLVILVPFATRWGALYAQVVSFHLAASQTGLGSTHGNILLLLQTSPLYPVAVVALLACIVAVWSRAWRMAPLFLWLVASAVLLVRQQPLFSHHVVLLVPPLVLMAALLPALVADCATAATPRWTGARAAGGRWAALALIVVVALVIGVTDLQANATAARPIATDDLQTAAALRAATVPDDLVVTDNQYVAALADRDVLPQLVDTSNVRIATGSLTASQLETLITRSDARVILFASGRFDQLPGFRAWVDAHYALVADTGNGRDLYVKKPQGPIVA